METLTEKWFSTPADRRFLDAYRRVFSIREIEEQKIVQIAFGALLLSLFLGLSRWFYSHAISISAYNDNSFVCWPYFQGCGKLYFLQALPEGYSQSIVFMGFFAMLALAVYFIYRKEWTLAHMIVAIVWLCKVGILFVLTQELAANYDYYDTFLLFVVLFLPYKLFFARLTLVSFYFLASTIKIHEGWIMGSYFTTLKTGMPIFGNAIAPIMTNLVIGMQITGSWLLFSKNRFWQRFALVYFMLFHIYSGILVGYRYPTVAFVMLVVLFAVSYWETYTPAPLTRRSYAGWYFIAILFVLQFISISIPGDQKLTLEGNFYGLFMFEANHQCVSTATVYRADGSSRKIVHESYDSTWRCDPYGYWFQLENMCDRDRSIDRVAWTFDHSINGGPFYRIVDEQNACALSYKAFSHNEWIKLPPEAQIVGYPLKNYFQ
jgi:hypothetical protein